jgi:hypothetical protein
MAVTESDLSPPGTWRQAAVKGGAYSVTFAILLSDMIADSFSSTAV